MEELSTAKIGAIGNFNFVGENMVGGGYSSQWHLAHCTP